MKKGPYDYLRDYSYPFVRDALFVLVNDVFDGDDRLNENMDLRGWAVLYPRSKKDAELLKCVLSNHDVKFEEYGDAVKFKYGQSSRIDDTVRQMANDLSLRNANEILRAAMRQVPLNQLKEMIVKISNTSGGTYGEYVDLYFPTEKSELADDLLQALGVYCMDSYVSRVNGKETKVLRYNSPMPEYVRDVFDELEQGLHARQVQNHVEHDEEVNDGKLNNPVQMAEVHDPEAEKKREQYVNDRKQALNQLKDMITNVDEVRSGDTHRGYFYLYFPADKIDLADELLQKLDIYAEKHVSHLDGIETMVLRYPATMVPGYFSEVYGELQDALHARKAKGDFEQGTRDVDDKAALHKLKLFVKEITRLPHEQELAHPDKLFYCFKCDEDLLDVSQQLLQQLGIPTEKVKNGIKPAFLLYSVDRGKVPDYVVEIIAEILDAKREQRAKQIALDGLKEMVTAVKRAKYDDTGEQYYYFYFPVNDLDKAERAMRNYVGIEPEVHVSHAGGVETTVLRYKIDEKSEFMDSIEELKTRLSSAVVLRRMGYENGGHIEM